MDFYAFCKSKMPNIFIDSDLSLKYVCEKMESKINNTNKMLFINWEHCNFYSTELSVLWTAWLNLNGNIWTAHISHNVSKRKNAKTLYASICNGELEQFISIGNSTLGFEGTIINNALNACNNGWSNYGIIGWFDNYIVSRITRKYPLICFYNNLDTPVIDYIKKEYPNNIEFYL